VDSAADHIEPNSRVEVYTRCGVREKLRLDDSPRTYQLLTADADGVWSVVAKSDDHLLGFLRDRLKGAWKIIGLVKGRVVLQVSTLEGFDVLLKMLDARYRTGYRLVKHDGKAIASKNFDDIAERAAYERNWTYTATSDGVDDFVDSERFNGDSVLVSAFADLSTAVRSLLSGSVGSLTILVNGKVVAYVTTLESVRILVHALQQTRGIV
jgi:hypothetical protein